MQDRVGRGDPVREDVITGPGCDRGGRAFDLWGRLTPLPPLLMCCKRRQVLFLLEKSPLQPPEFLVRADPSAHRFKRFCDLEALLDVFTRIRVTLGTCPNALIFTALHYTVTAPILRLAAVTGNFFVRNDVIPIADLRPQLCGAAQFLFCFLKRMQHVSRARRAVISACG